MKSIKKYLQEGGSLFGEGKYEEALELIDEAVALYPEDYDAQMNRKLLLTKLGYYEEMLESQKILKQLELINNSDTLGVDYA